jgi:hypothetical protein
MVKILLAFPIDSLYLQLDRYDSLTANSNPKHGAYIGDIASSVGYYLLAHPAFIPTETRH